MLDHLEDNIRRVIADIRPQMLEKVIENWTSRLDYIRASRGMLLRHVGTLNSRRAASPLVWLVEGEDRWEAPDHPQGFLPLNWSETEQKRTVTCMVLKDKANDRHGDRFNSCQVIYSQFGLAIHPNDHQARRRFVEWAQNEIAVVPDFHKRILFRDEAHFWLNGYVNKQTAAFGVKLIHEFNGDRYRGMVTNFFIPELKNYNVQELWFQQDGATCHTARATIDLLKDTFGDRLISRFGPVNWPPRSCDLTPLDYFLWGYVKSLVYADKLQTLDHLEDNIRHVIYYIRPQMLEKVIENWTSRLDYIRASRGSPMPEIIFKMQCQRLSFE
ncbi:transposable element Tc3 transposase [Trichonephila clavipes]|nr:transposable element Tc3 transposase [Trichonephila clavipes]